MVRTSETLQVLMAEMHEEDSSFKAIAPLAAKFRTFCGRLADRFAETDAGDRLLVSLAARLRCESIEMCLALYDNGEALRVAPR